MSVRRALRGLGLGVALVLLVLSMPGGALAQQFEVSASTFASGLMIVNLSSNVANVLIEFNRPDGTTVFSKTFQIGPNGVRTIYLPTDPEFSGLPSGFVGAAVISADQPIAASVNTERLTSSPSEPERRDSSPALDDSSTGVTLWMPQVMNNAFEDGWSSTCYVQNTSTAPVQVRVIIKSRFGGVEAYNQVVTIPANGVLAVDHTQLGLPAGFVGGMKVQALDGTTKLAGTCNFFANGADGERSQFNTYRAFNAGATVLHAPLVYRTFYDVTSGLAIQNIGTQPTSIAIDFTFPARGGRPEFRTTLEPPQCQNLQPDQSCTLYLKPNPDFPGWPDFLIGSAVIRSSGQPIIAIVNYRKDFRGDGKSESATYSAFLDNAKTPRAILPQITSVFYGFSSGYSIVNAGATPGTFTITYRWDERYRSAFYPGEPSSYIRTVTLNPGQAWARFVPDELAELAGKPITDFNGSLTIEGTQPLFAVSNRDYRLDRVLSRTNTNRDVGERLGDLFSQANGLNY